MTDSPIPPVPPNSTALRELAHVVENSLTLPRPATTRDELIYLRIVRDRARLVRLAMRRLLADHEAGDGDVMVQVAAGRRFPAATTTPRRTGGRPTGPNSRPGVPGPV